METEKFKELLDKEYTWPAVYSFKFIVPKASLGEARKLFDSGDIVEKPSKNGNYVSLNAKVEMSGSDAVMEVYLKANKIEGLIAL